MRTPVVWIVPKIGPAAAMLPKMLGAVTLFRPWLARHGQVAERSGAGDRLGDELLGEDRPAVAIEVDRLDHRAGRLLAHADHGGHGPAGGREEQRGVDAVAVALEGEDHVVRVERAATVGRVEEEGDALAGQGRERDAEGLRAWPLTDPAGTIFVPAAEQVGGVGAGRLGPGLDLPLGVGEGAEGHTLDFGGDDRAVGGIVPDADARDVVMGEVHAGRGVVAREEARRRGADAGDEVAFDGQVAEARDADGIEPGEVELGPVLEDDRAEVELVGPVLTLLVIVALSCGLENPADS